MKLQPGDRVAKASNLGHRPPRDERARYRDDQRAAVLRALADYNPSAMAVFGVDFGHTAPGSFLTAAG